ncbi:MAG: maleylpyruvate isomerase family mycothiol-dependent enzyme [Ilumatobacteraceae bacterium]
MTFLRPNDEVVRAYVSLRGRVIELLRSIPESSASLIVPLCPAWTVSALASHIIGVNEDILAGRMEGVTTDSWTQAQVDRHRGESLSQLADAWESTMVEFDVVLPHIPSPVNSQLVMDAVTHEHDLRHALGSTDARDTDAVEVAVGWLLDMAESRVSGLGHSLRDSTLSSFHVLRSLTGRRSVQQMIDLGLDGARIAEMLVGTPLKPPPSAIEAID